MTYHFDISHATRWGCEEAILLQNIIFWLRHNKANGKGLHDSKTWTYNSVRALSVLFPFWTPRQIDRIIRSLIEQGVLIRGEYNLSRYDKTSWYALEDESLLAIPPNGEIDSSEQLDRALQTVKPIPDIKQDENTDERQSEDRSQSPLFASQSNQEKRAVSGERKRRSVPEVPRPPIPVVEPCFEDRIWEGDLGPTVAHWQEIYKDIDVKSEMFKAMEYVIAHPEKRYQKWYAFLSNWMRNAQSYAERREHARLA